MTTTIPRPTLTTLSSTSSSKPGLGVPTRQSTSVIQGVPTNVLCQAFTDRILILVTQRRRVGCLIQAKLSTPTAPTASNVSSSSSSLPLSPEEAATSSATSSSATTNLPSLLPSIDLQPLFGSPPPSQTALYSFYASSLASLVHSDQSSRASRAGGTRGESDVDPRPIVVGLALRDSQDRAKGGEDKERDGDDEDWSEVQVEERGRFEEVVKLVREACVW